MLKQLAIPGVCLAAISSLLMVRHVVAAQQAGDASHAPAEAVLSIDAATSTAARSAAAAVYHGAQVASVPVALAAQLVLSDGSGLLVTGVQEGSDAQAAGLAPYDVIVSINGGDATRAELAASTAGTRGVALRVVRAGVEQSVAIGEAADVAANEAVPGFLSSATLGANHPFQRLHELQELRDGYSTKQHDYAERMRGVDAESKAARDAARQQVQALQERAEREVAEYFAPRERAWLELVDERLSLDSSELQAQLTELGLPWDTVRPGERAALAGTTLASARSALTEMAQRLQPRDGSAHDPKVLEKAQQRWLSLGKELAGLLDERVDRPWSSALADVKRHEPRFGKQHQERVQWTVATVASIREQVKERIRCAVRRTREDFAKQLQRRLSEMDVPKPGEVEACLESVRAQIDAMTRGFLSRTDGTLALYRAEMSTENGELAGRAETGLAASEGAFAQLAAQIDGLLQAWQPEALAFDGSWGADQELDASYQHVRMEARALLNRGRDGSRAGASELAAAFEEHRATSDDAWRDLQKLLGEVQERASNDCWKLRGPYLDGRFPEENTPDESRPAMKGEVARSVSRGGS